MKLTNLSFIFIEAELPASIDSTYDELVKVKKEITNNRMIIRLITIWAPRPVLITIIFLHSG